MTGAPTTKIAASQHHQLRNYLPGKYVLNELSDTELVKRYRLDCTGILFVTDQVRETLQSDT